MNFNLDLKLNTNLKNFYLWIPSNLFWVFSLIGLFVWIILGPISWRHFDDFGPIHEYITNDFSFKSWELFLKDRLVAGWGSYPPIWTIWQLISFPFAKIGLNQARNILMLQGFLSSLITGYLTTCLCLNFYTYIFQYKSYQIKKVKYFIEILSVSLNCFNPEIMFHASSYMPYNLSAITSISFLLLLFPQKYNYFENNKTFKNNIFKIPLAYFLFFCFLSLFFSFQSTIIFLAFFIAFFKKIINKKFLLKDISFVNFKKFIFLIKQVFSSIQKKFLFIFLLLFLFLVFSYFYKFFVLLATDTKAGTWSTGIDNLYDLNFSENDLKSWLIKSLNNTSSIIGLSLYPFRIFQDSISKLLSIFVIISFYIYFRSNKYLNLFFFNTIFLFLTTITLSGLDKFIYAPTRHTIYLYPYIWVIFIISLVRIFVFFEQRFKRRLSFNLANLSLCLYLFYLIGLSNSHDVIQYSNADREKLINLAKNADFHINLPYSFFPSHGSKEYRAFNFKTCDSKIDINKSKFFIFSHRDFAKKFLNNEYLKDILIQNSKGCVMKTDKIRVIDKIESLRRFDIEQNNNIYNGGSSIYAYLIEVYKE